MATTKKTPSSSSQAPAKARVGKNATNKSVATPKASEDAFKVRFFCADDIRIENDGKPMLIGFYADNVIVVNSPMDAKPTKEIPFGLASLTFMIAISGPPGKHKAKLIFDIFGQRSGPAQEQEFELTETRSSFNIVAKAQPFLVFEFGKQELKVVVDGFEFSEMIDIRRNLAV